MTRITPDWLTAPETREVMAMLGSGAPRFVGGCVRDALMGRVTQDIDIAVASLPEVTMEMARAGGAAAHPTGIDHGVVTLVHRGAVFEVATMRRDVATDGRRAVVAFTEDPIEDAMRRDFTMNALYADATGEVIDPLGQGLADLGARRIRFIGDATARIREDYLRILRFFRFHAQFGINGFDADGRTACHRLADGLSKISKERIGAEILKMLAAPDPEPALAAMGPVIAAALPGATPVAGLTTKEREMGLAPDPLRRLLALGGTAPKDALRLSNADAAMLDAMRAARDLPLEEAAYRHGARAAETKLALEGAAPPDWRARIDHAATAHFPVSAKTLIEAGWAPGPALGQTLRRLEADWIASGFTAKAEDLIASAR